MRYKRQWLYGLLAVFFIGLYGCGKGGQGLISSSKCQLYGNYYDNRIKNLTSIDDVRKTIQADLDKFQVDLQLGRYHAYDGTSGWESLSEKDLESAKKFAATFLAAWNKYSTRWVISSGLHSVVLVKNLKVHDHHRDAKPNHLERSVYYDVSSMEKCTAFQEEVIHHEYYHVIEGIRHGSYYHRDQKWMELNSPSFIYGNGGATAYKNPYWKSKELPFPGFLNTYATLGMEEDKAEVYAWLFSKGYSSKFSSWSASDPILAKKRAYMIAEIQKVSPELDGEYFSSMH